MSWRSRIANLQKSDLLGLTHPPGAPRPADRKGDLYRLLTLAPLSNPDLHLPSFTLCVCVCDIDAEDTLADIEERARERRRARARRRERLGEVRERESFVLMF